MGKKEEAEHAPLLGDGPVQKRRRVNRAKVSAEELKITLEGDPRSGSPPKLSACS